MRSPSINEEEFRELKQRRKHRTKKQVTLRRLYILLGVALVFQLGIVGGMVLMSEKLKQTKNDKAGPTLHNRQAPTPAQSLPVTTAERKVEVNTPPAEKVLLPRARKEIQASGAHDRKKQPGRILQRKINKETPPASRIRPAVVRYGSPPDIVPTASDLLHSYAAGVRAIVARHKEYHFEPGKRFTGRCLVICIINRDGSLKHAEIIKSSGNPELDSAAILSVKNAGQFPKIPEGISGEQFSFDVPVSFNIP